MHVVQRQRWLLLAAANAMKPPTLHGDQAEGARSLLRDEKDTDYQLPED